MVVVQVPGAKYYMNPILKKKWDSFKDGKLVKRDQDKVYTVDGRERTGKSVFTLQQAAYLDPTLIEDALERKDLSRICFSAEEFLEAIRKAKPGQVIVFDEAFRGLSSRAALSKTNKKIIQAMMEMGQKNLIVFIVLPSFFMLDLYVAMLRSNALFHVYKDKRSNRRYYKVYNYKKKARLYQHGVKKGWEYKVATGLKDQFSNIYPGGEEFEAMYRHKKRVALETSDEATGNKSEETKYMEKYHKLVDIIRNDKELSEKKAGKFLRDNGIDVSDANIGMISRRVRILPNT